MRVIIFCSILLLSCHKKKETPIFDQMRGEWVWIDDSKGIELKFTKRVYEKKYETIRGYRFNIKEEESKPDFLVSGKYWKRVIFKNDSDQVGILYNNNVDTLLMISYSYDIIINQQNDTVKRKYFVRK